MIEEVIKSKVFNLDEELIKVSAVLSSHNFKPTQSLFLDRPRVFFEGTEFDLIRAHRVLENYGYSIIQANRVYSVDEYATDSDTKSPQGMIWDTPQNEIVFRDWIKNEYSEEWHLEKYGDSNY